MCANWCLLHFYTNMSSFGFVKLGVLCVLKGYISDMVQAIINCIEIN